MGLVALLAISNSVRSAQAAEEVTIADMQAAARALGFLDNLPREGQIDVAIVYAARLRESKTQATQAAGWLNALPGPNKSQFHTTIISVDNLVQSRDHLDAVFLLPGLSSDAAAIIEVTRRRHLVSISNDRVCLDANCCVLMVRAEDGVEIVLQTALADAVGAKFSTVFTMMVKRR